MTDALQAVLITAGLILPGWGWARRGGEGLVVAMLVSWLSLFAWTLLTTLIPVTLSAGYLIAGQMVTGVTGWMAAKRSGVRKWGVAWDLKLGIGWGVLPLGLVAGWKAVAQPLSGVDVDFRWNHLAEMMVKHGGLDFYPPTAAEDFVVYFWADGIPPLISSLYAWGYLVAGDTTRVWTAIPVLLQWLGLLALVRRLGTHWGGPEAGGWALLLAAATFLFQFAANLGQETACTALGAGVMVWGIARSSCSTSPGANWVAGLGATILALSREYGIAIAAAGFVAQAAMGLKRDRRWPDLRGWWLMLIPLGWFLRTWVRSGNPWLSLSLGGLFPVNPIFAEWISGYHAIYGESISTVAGWKEIGRVTLLTAAPAGIGFLVGAFLLWKQPGWLAAVGVGAATVGCWLLSVPYTAGGVFYSMRVLSPLLALGCAMGGAVLAAHLSSRRSQLTAAVGLGLVSIDASARALTTSVNPWTIPPTTWPTAGYAWQDEFWREQEKFIGQVIEVIPGRFVGDASGLQRYFTAADRDFIPWWSPEVREMFGVPSELDPIEALRSRGITHMVFHRAEFTRRFLERTGVLARLDGRIRGVMANDVFVVFELTPIDQ